MPNKISSSICIAACLGVLAIETGCSVNINGSVRTSTNEVVEHDLKTINGSVRVAGGSVVKGDCKTVNGSVELGKGAKADSLKTVNGSIKLKAEASVEDEVETVNGKISAEGNNVIGGDVTTVNGGVKLGEGVEVEGNVRITNGTIEFTGAHVKRDVTLRSGKVDFKSSTVVDGDLVVDGTKKKAKSENPLEIFLSDQTVIRGNIIVEDPEREVILHIQGDARVEGTIENVIQSEE